MNNRGTQQNNYRLVVRGRLNESWAENWGMTLRFEDGLTVIEGSLVDQSALHGLLNNMRDLNLTIISVECTDCF